LVASAPKLVPAVPFELGAMLIIESSGHRAKTFSSDAIRNYRVLTDG
jgi:hypothetical protein